MEADFGNGDKFTHGDEDDDQHTSSSESDDIAEEVEQESEEEEHRWTHPYEDTRKRTHVDDHNTLPHVNDDGHSRSSLHHSHVHKHERTSPPSASMRFYKRSLSLALRRARRQPITRSLTTRLTRSGAKFFKHDQDSKPPSPSSRSTNLHGARRHTPASYGSQLRASSLKTAKQSSSSKIHQNFSPEKDELLELNDDIAIRYLNSSPSFYALLDLDLNPGNESLPSSSPSPDDNQLYLGPEMDIAIKYDDSSPKIYTLLDGINLDLDLDSPTPSSPKASYPKIKDSPIRSPSSSSLKRSPSSISPRVDNSQDRRKSAPWSPSTMPSKFKPSSHKKVDRLFSSRSPSPVYSPASPKYASSSQVSPRSVRWSAPYSPTPSSSKISLPKSYNHLFSSRSPSPVRSSISPTYAPSPLRSSTSKGLLPCPPSFKHSSPRTFKLRGSPSRSLVSPSFKSSPRNLNYGFSSWSSPSSQSPISQYGPTMYSSGSPSRNSYDQFSPQRKASPRLSGNSLNYTSSQKSSDRLSPKFASSPRTSSLSFSPASSSSPTPSTSSRFSSSLINDYNQTPPLLANSPSNSRSPVKSFNKVSSANSPMHPNFSSRPKHDIDCLQSSFSPRRKYCDYWSQSPVETTSSPPNCPTSNAQWSSLQCRPPLDLTSTHNLPHSNSSLPLNPRALNHPNFSPQASSKARSPSISSQDSPVDDYWSQVRRTYSLHPSSPRKPPSNDPQSSFPQDPLLPLAFTSNSSSTNCSPPHKQALNQPGHNLSFSRQSRSPSKSSQGYPSVADFRFQVRGKPSLFSSSSPKGSSRSSSPSSRVRTPATSSSPRASMSPTQPSSPLSSTQSPFKKTYHSSVSPFRRFQSRSPTSTINHPLLSKSQSPYYFPSVVSQSEATSLPPVKRFASSKNSQNHSISGGLRPTLAIHAHATQYRPRNEGQQRVNTTQNNQSRPYRSTPHPNYLKKLVPYPQTSESSRGSPLNAATSVRTWGGKSSKSSESLGNKEGALPLHSRGLPSPTSSTHTSYYSALSSPSRSQDMSPCYQDVAPSSRRDMSLKSNDLSSPTSSSNTSYYSALSSPSWYQDMSSLPSSSPTKLVQETYYSAQSTPLTHSSYYSAPSSPSWYQDVSSLPSHSVYSPTTAVQETYYSVQSTPSVQETYFSAKGTPSPSFQAKTHSNFPSDRETNYSAASTPSPIFYSSQATIHKDLEYCPSEQEIYRAATRTPSPSFYNSTHKSPSQQETYHSAQSTPSKATMHKNFDHYPLTSDSRSQSPSASRLHSSGSKRPRSGESKGPSKMLRRF